MFDFKSFSPIHRLFLSEQERMEIKWALITQELMKREDAAETLIDKLKDSDYTPNERRLIAETVMTIENAQTYLTQKADGFYRLGIFTALLAALIMLVMGIHLLLDVSISTQWMSSFIIINSDNKPLFNNPTYDFIAYTMKRLAGGGFIAGLIIFLISLARSFFHESTAFKNERHNIRLGKLIPYAVTPEKMNFKEFQEVTQWGKESNSAFKDIRPESSGKTILTYSVEAIKAMSEAVKNTKNQDNTSQPQGASK